MAEHHRKRPRQFKVSLYEEELEVLERKAETASMTKTEYVRSVVLLGATRGRTNFSKEDAGKIRYELNRIGNNINQIAYQANLNCGVSKNDFYILREQFVKLVGEFDEIVSK